MSKQIDDMGLFLIPSIVAYEGYVMTVVGQTIGYVYYSGRFMDTIHPQDFKTWVDDLVKMRGK